MASEERRGRKVWIAEMCEAAVAAVADSIRTQVGSSMVSLGSLGFRAVIKSRDILLANIQKPVIASRDTVVSSEELSYGGQGVAAPPDRQLRTR